MLFSVVLQDFLGTLVLRRDEILDLLVDGLSRLVGIGLGEVVFLIVVIAEVGKFIAHTQIGHHAVSTLGDALQIVERTAGDMAEEHFLCGTSGQRCTDFVEHLLLGRDATLLGQIPSGTERLATGHNRHLHQRIGIFQEP